jgi:ribosomal 50S subunit-recycling heat shock protein
MPDDQRIPNFGEVRRSWKTRLISIVRQLQKLEEEGAVELNGNLVKVGGIVQTAGVWKIRIDPGKGQTRFITTTQLELETQEE